MLEIATAKAGSASQRHIISIAFDAQVSRLWHGFIQPRSGHCACIAPSAARNMSRAHTTLVCAVQLCTATPPLAVTPPRPPRLDFAEAWQPLLSSCSNGLLPLVSREGTVTATDHRVTPCTLTTHVLLCSRASLQMSTGLAL